MTLFSPFHDSLWSASAPPGGDHPALEGDETTEICIVGGGYAGLHTALRLAKAGRKVTLLEAEEVGFGGSGRNAGHCTPTFHHHSLDGIRKLLGRDRGDRLIALQLGAADRIGEIVARHGIDCEWVQNGYVMAAPTPAALPALRAKADSYNAAGQSTRMMDADEVRALTGMQGQHGGWFHSGGAHLNPLGLSRGLAQAAEKAGARICEHSLVQSVQRDDARWRVTTPVGSVTCDRLVMATGAYTRGGWPGLDRTFRIMRVMVAATEPAPDLVERLLPGNVTVHDGRGNILVYKRDAFGRIVASMFPRRFGGADRMRRLLTARMQYHHPEFPGTLRWQYLWTGELDMQRRTIPRLYRLGDGAVAVTGLSGRGVPTGAVLGEILSDWADDKPESALPLPVEPLSHAPAYMAVAPQLSLIVAEATDRFREWRHGAPPRPH